MDLTYIEIKGTVGKTKVDLTLGVPVGTIIKQVPAIIKGTFQAAPEIIKAVIKGVEDHGKEIEAAKERLDQLKV